jgi:uncharacterized protein with FMN-binding domain
MPKRGVAALLLTSFALVLLLNFKTPDSPVLGAGRLGTSGRGNTAVVAPADRSGASRATPAPLAGTGNDGGQATEGGSGGGGGSRQGAAATPAPTQRTSAGLADGTKAGDTIQTRFGPVQVNVTISNGKIVDITAVQLPFDHPRSAAISQYVEPVLRNEALQAQSPQIDIISGATYTSIAYARSLQSALDQARNG